MVKQKKHFEKQRFMMSQSHTFATLFRDVSPDIAGNNKAPWTV
jgi:hypothetical protein